MDGDFTMHKPGFYTVKNVAQIEDFDPDQYGNIWYNVVFQGDAETFMWLAKNQPEENKRYYGHLEPTKSGKRLRFKTDKQPDDLPSPVGASLPGATPKADKAFLKDASTIPMDVYRVVANIRGLPENDTDKLVFWEMVRGDSEELLVLIDNVRNSGSQGRGGETPVSTPHATNEVKTPPATRRNWIEEAQDELG